MRFAALLATALVALLSSCATEPTSTVGGTTAPASQSTTPTADSATGSAITPRSAYRGAREAASAINTVRTLGSLF